MECLACRDDYYPSRGFIGMCQECYEDACEMEKELKHEIDELKSKVKFLLLLPVLSGPNSFCDIYLMVSCSTDPSIPAHRAVLASRSPIFKAMFENEMEESLSGTIKISDASYNTLRVFVNYMYTAGACLDEHMAYDLLALAEKYQVKHLKTCCEKYLMSILNWENSLTCYAFAQQHGAKRLVDATLSLIMDNMDKLSEQEEYRELVEKDPRVVIEIYETYMSKRVNSTAASKDPAAKA